MSEKQTRKDKTTSLTLEHQYYLQGHHHIFGIDEAGRGPMAGPLVAATVCLPLHNLDAVLDALKGVKDSKKMTLRQRENAFETIQSVALTWGIGEVSAQEIPTIGNMTTVTYTAMHRALKNAFTDQISQPDVLFVDYLTLPNYDAIPQESLVKGESKSLSIAAASVLAKVYRDNQMIAYAKDYPEYGFDKHKGYITKAHREALQEYGPCAIHRTNYAPVQRAYEQHNS